MRARKGLRGGKRSQLWAKIGKNKAKKGPKKPKKG